MPIDRVRANNGVGFEIRRTTDRVRVAAIKPPTKDNPAIVVDAELDKEAAVMLAAHILEAAVAPVTETLPASPPGE